MTPSIVLLMAGLVWILPQAASASALDAYILRPGEIPPQCVQIPGAFPANDKIASFFDYKIYSETLPPLADKRAQSFDCQGDKGSILSFQYQDARGKDTAMLFARPVLSRTIPAPVFVEWTMGFALVSFKTPPPALVSAMQQKVSGKSVTTPVPSAVSVSSATSPSPSVALPTVPAPPKPVAPPVAVPVVVVSTPAFIHSSGPAAMPPALPAPVSAAHPMFTSTLADVQDSVLNELALKLECKDRGAAPQTRTVCGWLEQFRKGQSFEPIVPNFTVMMGPAFRLDSYGRFEQTYFDAVIGSGQPGEIALFPVVPFTGQEDFEAQAIIEAKQKGQPLPKNEIYDRIMKRSRPSRPAAKFTSNGKSVVMDMGAGKKVFLRKSGNSWVFLSVTGEGPEQQTRQNFILGILY
jgi:hypothetical protein